MKKILITGGAGYIGSTLSTLLVKKKYDVTVIDDLRYSSSSLNHLFFYKNFKLIKNDICNDNLLKKYVKKNDIIIPLAALVGAPLCEKFKKEAVRTNLDSIKKIVKFSNGNQKIIFMNTNSGYGVGEKNKFCDEKSKLSPISLYGQTKVEAEKIVMSYKNSICFRLATVFGYSYRMRSDLLVNFYCKEAVKKNKLKLYEPHFRRNYVHVKDVANGIFYAIKNFNKMKGEVYNLGLSSANLTKIQLANKIKKFLPKFNISIIDNKRDPDQRDYFVSNKKIEKKGFKAKISLNTGVKELIEFFNINTKNIKNNY